MMRYDVCVDIRAAEVKEGRMAPQDLLDLEDRQDLMYRKLNISFLSFRLFISMPTFYKITLKITACYNFVFHFILLFLSVLLLAENESNFFWYPLIGYSWHTWRKRRKGKY